MKKYSLAVFAMTLAMFSLSASSGVMTLETSMTLETRKITNGVNDTDFISSWNNQSSAINTRSVSDFTSYRSGRYSLSHLSLNFFAGQSGLIGFEAGLDAGYGAALYFDDVLVNNRTDDLWWAYQWSSADVLSASGFLAEGAHTMDLYWAEKCCNGASSGRFTVDGGASWQALSIDNINRVASVPEPGSVALLGLGLIGLISMRRIQG
jgi:hypothetical protein